MVRRTFWQTCGAGAMVLGIATGKSRRGVAHLIANHGYRELVRNGADLGRRIRPSPTLR